MRKEGKNNQMQSPSNLQRSCSKRINRYQLRCCDDSFTRQLYLWLVTISKMKEENGILILKD